MTGFSRFYFDLLLIKIFPCRKMSVVALVFVISFILQKGIICFTDIFRNLDCTLDDFVICILMENMEKTLFVFFNDSIKGGNL
jgi:hypothetical protein